MIPMVDLKLIKLPGDLRCMSKIASPSYMKFSCGHHCIIVMSLCIYGPNQFHYSANAVL